MKNNCNRFYKVSFGEFSKALHDMPCMLGSSSEKSIYDAIKLPMQATKGSAGHNFFSPIGFSLLPGESITIPMGVRAKIKSNRFLAIFPRSGLGFKYRMQLDNTVGIIDEDYFGAGNEGHIFIKLTNDSRSSQVITIKVGEAIAQGIIIPYEIAEGAEAGSENIRTGGFGSTTDGFEFGSGT